MGNLWPVKFVIATSIASVPPVRSARSMRQGRGLGLEQARRRARAGFELGRRGLHAELGPEAVEQAEHEGIAAEERVARQGVAVLPEHGRDPTGPRTAGI